MGQQLHLGIAAVQATHPTQSTQRELDRFMILFMKHAAERELLPIGLCRAIPDTPVEGAGFGPS